MTTHKPTIPQRLQDRRVRAGLSKAECARRVNVTRMTYDMWERGAWTPQPDKAEDIAKFLKLPVANVLTDLLRMNEVMGEDLKVGPA